MGTDRVVRLPLGHSPMVSFEDAPVAVVDWLRDDTTDEVRVVAVDGHSAAGESSFARMLVDRVRAVLVAGDDFYLGVADGVERVPGLRSSRRQHRQPRHGARHRTFTVLRKGGKLVTMPLARGLPAPSIWRSKNGPTP
jgi:hypothetical protein